MSIFRSHRDAARARAAYVVLGETTYFRVFDVMDDAGNVVGTEIRQRVIIRDADGVLRHGYPRPVE